MSDLPPPDWYTDPEDPAQYRYWDGSRWTDHRAPRHSSSDELAGASGGGAGRHRRIGDLLSGTWRLMTQNLRTVLVIYAVVAVVYLAGEEAFNTGFDEMFGGTLTALIDELTALDPDPADDEEYRAVLESRVDDVTDRIEGLGSSGLAAAVLLMALGAVVVVAVNVVEFAALGQVAVARLSHRPMGASRALRAGLGRLLRMVGVGLMLLAIFVAALMATGLVAGLFSLASGALAAVLAVVLVLAVLVLAAGAVPLVLLALMTAAVGPAEPSVRYARGLLKGAYWATFGRMMLITVLSAVASVPAVVAGELLGLFNDLLGTVALVGLGALPEVLAALAYFTLYRDLGGEHAEVAEEAASRAD